MELTDFIMLNMLKSQLLVIYEKYSAKPELLSDPNIRLAYNLLVKADCVDDLRKWHIAAHNVGLTFDNADGIEREDNILGSLDDLITNTDSSILARFILWKRGIVPASWHHVRECSRKTVKMLEDAVTSDFNAHIVLIKCGDIWAAIGDDADRLFELLGWQTGYVNDGEKDVSWMYVNNFGMKVLEDSKYTVKVLDLGKVDVVSTAFTEDMLASVQQYIDWLRIVSAKAGKITDTIDTDVDIVLRHNGIKYKEHIGRFAITGGSVRARFGKMKDITVADGHSWRTDDIGLSVLLAMAQTIDNKPS